MFTTKKLSEIKRQLYEALNRDRKKVTDWLEREMAAQRNAGAAKVSENLIWVRYMVREAAEAEKPHRNKSKKARKKKTMARSA
jgi:hypothetical protein